MNGVPLKSAEPQYIPLSRLLEIHHLFPTVEMKALYRLSQAPDVTSLVACQVQVPGEKAPRKRGRLFIPPTLKGDVDDDLNLLYTLAQQGDVKAHPRQLISTMLPTLHLMTVQRELGDGGVFAAFTGILAGLLRRVCPRIVGVCLSTVDTGTPEFQVIDFVIIHSGEIAPFVLPPRLGT